MRNTLLSIILLLVFATIGCTRKVYVPIETQIRLTDTLYKVRWQSDTIYNSDTVRIEKNGDTVKITSIKWRIRGKEKCDTVIHYRDTTTEKVKIVTRDVIKEVNKLYWWQSILMWLGGLSLIFIGYRLYKVIRLVR